MLLIEYHLLQECHQHNLAIVLAPFVSLASGELSHLATERMSSCCFDSSVIIIEKFGVNFGYIMAMAMATLRSDNKVGYHGQILLSLLSTASIHSS